jgi:hypothetical protein
MGNVFPYSPVSLNKTKKSLLTLDEEEEILTGSIGKTEAELKELLERIKERIRDIFGTSFDLERPHTRGKDKRFDRGFGKPIHEPKSNRCQRCW